jgi:transcriptional regulator with XRE-family HTH domain
MAKRSGIRFSTYRLFEKKGDSSLDRLLKMAEVLGRLDDFSNVLEDREIPRLSGPAPDWKRPTVKKGISA